MRIEKVNQTSSSANVFFPYGNLPYPLLQIPPEVRCLIGMLWGPILSNLKVFWKPDGILEIESVKQKSLFQRWKAALTPQKPIDPKLRPVLLLLSTSFAITWVAMMEKFAPRLLVFAPYPGEMCAKDDRGNLKWPLVFGWSSGLVCRGWPYLHKEARWSVCTP